MFNISFSFYQSTVNSIKYASCLTLLIFLLGQPAQARYFSANENTEILDVKAKNAMHKGNYAIAYCIWQPMAEEGDSASQYNIGWMYHNGYGLSIDDEMALFWWLKSAAKGNIDAHFALGDLYAQGQGVTKDLSIAIGWYISAAIKGHETARETLMDLLNSNNKLALSTFQQLLKTNWSILGDTMQVSVNKANARRGPDKSYKVVTTLEKGHVVIPLREKNGWTYVGITGSGKTAWIFSKLISKPAGIYPVE